MQTALSGATVTTTRAYATWVVRRNFLVKQFYEDITRGGLLALSTSNFGACLKAWLVYQNMMGFSDMKRQFLKSDRQQELFVRTVMYLLS